MMGYVYVKSEPALWTVGYHAPEGEWISESDWGSQDEAAQRVHWLNGGRAQDNTVDMIADDQTEVEIQPEAGFKDRFKLYVHQGGRTIVRVCKIRQVWIDPDTGYQFAKVRKDK